VLKRTGGVQTDNEPWPANTIDKWDGDELWSVVSTKGSQWTTIDFACKHFGCGLG
jgi:regulation of enolase protein 1 (concanavalin A-like superfamily)